MSGLAGMVLSLTSHLYKMVVFIRVPSSLLSGLSTGYPWIMLQTDTI
jgi:hypothetical protein